MNRAEQPLAEGDWLYVLSRQFPRHGLGATSFGSRSTVPLKVGEIIRLIEADG